MCEIKIVQLIHIFTDEKNEMKNKICNALFYTPENPINPSKKKKKPCGLVLLFFFKYFDLCRFHWANLTTLWYTYPRPPRSFQPLFAYCNHQQVTPLFPPFLNTSIFPRNTRFTQFQKRKYHKTYYVCSFTKNLERIVPDEKKEEKERENGHLTQFMSVCEFIFCLQKSSSTKTTGGESVFHVIYP